MPGAAVFDRRKLCPVSAETRPVSTNPTGLSMGLPSLSRITSSPTVSDHLQAYALSFECGGIWAVVVAFNGRGVHEVQLDETNSPFPNQRLVGLAQVFLRPRMCRIERIKRVRVLPPHIPQGNRLALGIVDQPILVMFVSPGAVRYLERRRPETNGQAISQNPMSDKAHAVRELRCVGGDVLSARILIAFIDLEIVVTERFQILRQPIGIRQGLALVDRGIISGPAPPSGWNLTRNAWAMQPPNCGTIGEKLPMVVRPSREHQSFRAQLFARIQWKTQFDPVARRRICQIEILLNLRGSGRFDGIG